MRAFLTEIRSLNSFCNRNRFRPTYLHSRIRNRNANVLVYIYGAKMEMENYNYTIFEKKKIH